MVRLLKEARYNPDTDPADSGEIDRSFNKAVGTFMEKAAEERKQNELQKSPPQPAGKLYYLKGHFSEDGMPIPLEENFRAESLEEAKKTTRERVKYYHNLEGYAVIMHLSDTLNYPRKDLYSFSIRAKK